MNDEGGWQGCDSRSNNMCLARECVYAKVPYLIDEGAPEVECSRPAGEKWRRRVEERLRARDQQA